MEKIVAALTIGVVLGLIPASAQAVTIDPSPFLRDAALGPPGSQVSARVETLFFCPLSKVFYKDPDQIPVETLILEAVGEGFEGMIAVGEVIRNRTKLFARSEEAVCLMPKQFSCWNDPARAERFLADYRHYRFVARLAWWASLGSDRTLGATDYHASYVQPYWAAAYTVAARLGRHVFYVRT